MNYQTYIISANRPQNVKRLKEIVFNPMFVIRDEDEQAYKEAGARYVTHYGGLIGARNWAIDHAFAVGDWCVQISDDFEKLKRLTADGTTVNVSIEYAIDSIINEMLRLDVWLGGCAPTDNAFFGSMNVKDHHFIVGDFMIMRPPCPLRFDNRLKLKEDYDFTLQHLATFGQVARLDYLLPSFKHRTNKGGAVDYRTAELEQENIKYLKQKWPDNIKDNPRRENEVLLKWKI